MQLKELITKLESNKSIVKYGLKNDIKQLNNINYGIVHFFDKDSKMTILYAFIFNDINSNDVYGFTRFTNENLYQFLYAIEEKEIDLLDLLNSQIEKNNNLHFLLEYRK